MPGTSGPVQAMARHDPDGPGPLPAVLLMGGRFDAGGDAVVDGLAAYDPVTGRWSRFAGSVVGPGGIRALLSLSSGELIAGGAFHTIGGVLALNIARWDGTSWSPFGTFGASAAVNALAVLPNGDLVAGGEFVSVSGVGASRIARWDGAQWNPMGSGLTATVRDLAVRANGNLLAAGDFPGGVAEWNGSAWNIPTPSLLGSSSVHTVLELPGGDLLVGGDFWFTGGLVQHVARWDGSTWSAVGAGLNGTVLDLALHPSGDVYAGGNFDYSATTFVYDVARWDGTRWNSVGFGYSPAYSSVTDIVLWPGGGVFAGGIFDQAGGAPASNVAFRNASGWSALGPGIHADIASLQADGSALIAGGRFSSIAGIRANNIARFDGISWSPLGVGVDGDVRASVSLPNGDLVVGGDFTAAGGAPARNIAAWNGTGWQAMAGANVSTVQALSVLPNGMLLAGGSASSGQNCVTAWNGNGWSPYASFGSVAMGGIAKGLAVLPGGDVVAIGHLDSPPMFVSADVARWDGVSWTSMGQVSGLPNNEIHDLCLLPGGDLVVAGEFAGIQGVPAANIARWDGSSWRPLGAGLRGQVRKLTVLADGDLVATGSFEFAGGAPARNAARWDGVAWHPLGAGLNAEAVAGTVMPDGTLVVGGPFSLAGGVVSSRIARWQPSCPATAASLGAACPSTGGPMDLRATSLPWLGGVYAARCTGMAPGGLGMAVVGLTSPSIPLGSLHPTGVPNCNLLASPDVTLLLLPSGGATSFAFPVPTNPAHVGLPLYTQVLQLVLGPLQNPLQLSGSNALQVTIGTY